MKKNIFFATVAILCGLWTLSSCDDFLTENDPNKISVSSYFTEQSDVEKALDGAYSLLRNNSCMGEGSTLYTEERSDNTGRLDNQSSSGEPFQFTNFSLLPSNSYLKSYWDALYQTINSCNFTLWGAENVTFSDDKVKQNIIAEAKFIRALVYFEIVRKWGDAPLVTTYYTTPTEIKAHTERIKQDVIYGQIVQDLKDALNSTLPDRQPAGGRGHADKASITGLLGKVYLTMAATLNSENKTEYLNDAKTYLTQCYSMRQFGMLKEIPYEDVFNVDKKSTCPEIIFQIVYKQGDKDFHSSIAANNQSKGSHTNSLVNSTGMGTFVNPDLVKEYENDDIRKKWSVEFSNGQQAWFITKFRDTSDLAGTLGYGGNDWIILRYADVILMLAEVNEALGNDQEAVSYLNQVRERAGLPPYDEAMLNTDYKSKYPSLKLAILHERRCELAFENQRWYDLLRFFQINDLINYIHSKNQEDYGISNLKNFGTKDIYFPIPYDEWKLDPEKMYQNNGY